MTMKRYEDWKGNMEEYLQVGDLVDEDFVDYFLGVLPPACMNSHCIQIGEPHNHINGRATYATLKKTSDGWSYAGNCHRGETEEP